MLLSSFLLLHWNMSERHVSRDEQMPCAIQICTGACLFPRPARRCQNTCSSNAFAGSSSPISHCECLLRTQQSCRRAACHAGPTCPVLVVSTLIDHVTQRLQIYASTEALRPRLSSVSVGNSYRCSWSKFTHLGLERHVEESRRDSDHVGERQEGGASGPAEVFVPLDVHV